MAKVREQQLRDALVDVDYPADKRTLLDHAMRNGADAAPQRYTHVVFACGPAHGTQVRWLHRRFAPCRRIAVGVTVVDPSDPAVTGFDVVLARDTTSVPDHPEVLVDELLDALQAPVPVGR